MLFVFNWGWWGLDGLKDRRPIDSPRLRYAGPPSLRKRKEGVINLTFFFPLSAAGEERVVQRSVDWVSPVVRLLLQTFLTAGF
jgi:hypothetical protein